MKNKQGYFWVTIFIIIFLLSQDYLFTERIAATGVLGFPSWLGWFMMVHVVFIGAFYFFSKKYWK